ncbi:MAG: hypothetical protein RH980_18280 [Roseovarius confluentis]|jgi:hypothetical protein
MQSRAGSAIEAVVNVGLGLIINTSVNLAVLPLFGLAPSFGDALGIALVFTGVSVVRSYLVRRVFAVVSDG